MMGPLRLASAAVLLTLWSVPALAQGFSIRLQGKVTEYYSGDALRGALVRVLRGGEDVGQKITRGDGRYAFQLERGWKYEVWFSKKNMVTKHVVIDTRDVPAYPDVPFYEMDLQLTLFPWIEGVDLAAFSEPLGLAMYKPSIRNMSWETAYTEQMRAVFSKVMDQYEKTDRGYFDRRRSRGQDDYR